MIAIILKNLFLIVVNRHGRIGIAHTTFFRSLRAVKYVCDV